MTADISLFPLPSQVAAEAAKCFPDEDSAFILEVLNLYGSEPGELHREWMQMYLVQHACGDLALLLRSVEEAKRGYKQFLDRVRGEALSQFLAKHPHISITLMPYEPPEEPISRERAVHWLGISWPEFDRWVEERKLRPLRQPGPPLFAVADLERLQREREDSA